MIPIDSIMTTKVYSVLTQTPIFEALDMLHRHKISGLPVVDSQDRVIGILTQKDVLKILLDERKVCEQKVEDYMCREVVCFTEEDSAVDICRFFMRSNIRRVPIVRDGKLIGIVSRRDIVELILEAREKISDFRYV